MKNKLTRKLMLSAFTLLFAVISLGASTYAWFTMSDKANVEAFTAEVKAGEGIEIAVTAAADYSNAQWYTGTLPASVIQGIVDDLGKNLANGFEFDAVTPVDNTFAQFNKKDAVAPSGFATATGGYIDFYLHIKAAQPGTISLTGIEFATSNDDLWKVDAEYVLDSKAAGTEDDVKAKVNDVINYQVENAARIAFLYKNTSAVYEKAALAYSINQENGVITANNQIGCTQDDGAISYYNSKVKEQLTKPAAELYTTKAEIGQDDGITALDLAEVSGPTEVLSIQVKVWIEGWDAECLNAIFAQTLSVTLAFNYKAKTN